MGEMAPQCSVSLWPLEQALWATFTRVRVQFEPGKTGSESPCYYIRAKVDLWVLEPHYEAQSTASTDRLCAPLSYTHTPHTHTHNMHQESPATLILTPALCVYSTISPRVKNERWGELFTRAPSLSAVSKGQVKVVWEKRDAWIHPPPPPTLHAFLTRALN